MDLSISVLATPAPASALPASRRPGLRTLRRDSRRSLIRRAIELPRHHRPRARRTSTADWRMMISARLTYRPFGPGDREELLAFFRRPGVRRHLLDAGFRSVGTRSRPAPSGSPPPGPGCGRSGFGTIRRSSASWDSGSSSILPGSSSSTGSSRPAGDGVWPRRRPEGFVTTLSWSSGSAWSRRRRMPRTERRPGCCAASGCVRCGRKGAKPRVRDSTYWIVKAGP